MMHRSTESRRLETRWVRQALCACLLAAVAGCNQRAETPSADPAPPAIKPIPDVSEPAATPDAPAAAGDSVSPAAAPLAPDGSAANTAGMPDKSTNSRPTEPIQPSASAVPAEPTSPAPAAAPAAATAPEGSNPIGQQPKFNPIETNGRFFEGWTKPKLALVITGRQDGYLEPCGCAGLENQKGGLGRRDTFLKQLEAEGWPLAAVDVGSLVRRFGKQPELQFGISVDALRLMKYVAVGFGAADLRLSAGEVAAAVTGTQPDQNIFVSANVDVFGLVPRVRIVERGGMKLGIAAVLGDGFRGQLNNAELQVQPAAAALEQILPELAACDLKILLANAPTKECEDLARQFPQFNVVVTGEGPDEPLSELKRLEGTQTMLVEVGHKGMYAIVLGFYDDPQRPVRYQRVALDSRFAGAPEMKNLMTTYQAQLQALGWSGLGLRPATHPRSRGGDAAAGEFVGAASCRECHAEAWDVWSKSKHATSTETLVKLQPPRQFDPECVSCHVTGWNPQEFFPYKTGFESLEKTPQLAGNSCENCHGPAAAHVAAERGDNPLRRDEWRKLLHLDKADADEQSCRKCHDLDNSPAFKFEKYWKEIAH